MFTHLARLRIWIPVALLMAFIVLKNVDVEYRYNLNTSYYGLVICLNSLLPVYFLGFCWCSVKLWQPAVFYYFLVLSLITNNFLKRKNLKELQLSFCDFLLFCNECCALSHYTVQLTINVIPLNRKCGICLSGRIIVYILYCFAINVLPCQC